MHPDTTQHEALIMTAIAFEPGDELCPPMYSELLWWLIHHPHGGGGGPGPGDPDPWYQKVTHDLVTSLSIHALSFQLQDQKEAQAIRHQAQAQIARSAQQLGAAR